MTERPPHPRTPEQLRGSHPRLSAWVGASAGTGKTQVLTDRTLRLMLTGTPPTRILCLTFTKAAAAEMANRIAARLAEWVRFDDAALDADIKALTGSKPDATLRKRARALFATVLDAPGGLKIDNIHAFCQSVLRRFPLEAAIQPHFELMDERGAAELLREARRSVLARARERADPALAAALARVARYADANAFDALLQALAGQRTRLGKLLAAHAGIEGIARALRDHLDLGQDETPESVIAAAAAESAIDRIGLMEAVAALGKGSKSDKDSAATIGRWLAADAEGRVAMFEAYRGRFLTEKDEVRKKLATKSVLRASPHTGTVLTDEARRVQYAVERRKSATIAVISIALVTLGNAILETYRIDKQRRARLDYDDLVLGVRDLLHREGLAPWVLYKLDGGLDHVLIDEAQDTNVEQWQVVAALTAEFFAGKGASDVTRTIFAVGDPKQSIFSFQGAEPKAFLDMRAMFAAKVRAGDGEWRDEPLEVSFRSAPAILKAVDAVFATPAAQDGVALDGREIVHVAHRKGQAGSVELWPPVAARGSEAMPEWSPPVTAAAGDDPCLKLAWLIAIRIKAMLDSGEALPSRGRPVRAGDIMILVRRRDRLVEGLVRELKQRRVPVAGVDRLTLTEHIAVMDLMALGRFVLLPEDDLTLATVLKSPLIGLDEDQLFLLAHGREGSLWQALVRRRAEGGAFAEAAERLGQWLARADYVPPFEFYAELLGRDGGRRKMLERLGMDAADPIDEFLTLALQYERQHVPSLQGFLAWLEGGRVEVKRELDRSAGQVRIMTVHGAKGLQAPIVFLPDTMQVARARTPLLWSDAGDEAMPLWSPKADMDDTAAADARVRAKDADLRESRRLLYVAMTRAEDRLFIAGWRGDRDAPEECWYRLIEAGLAAEGDALDFDSRPEMGEEGWSGAGRRLSNPQTEAPDQIEPAAGVGEPPVALPDWATAPPRPEPSPSRPLTPSRPEMEEPAALGPSGGDREHLTRGLLVHRLLQLLPDLPASERRKACRRYLRQKALGLDERRIEDIEDGVMRVLEDPELASLFGPTSLAEVPFAGEIKGAEGRAIAVTGRVDRLVVEGDRVMAIDFKTNRLPAASEADIPKAYLWQMALTRAALQRVYPGKSVTCGLLWTVGPKFMPLTAERLDASLP